MFTLRWAARPPQHDTASRRTLWLESLEQRLTPAVVASNPLATILQGATAMGGTVLNQTAPSQNGGGTGSQSGNGATGATAAPASSNGGQPGGSTGGFNGATAPTATQSANPGGGNTGTNPNSTAELFSPAQVTSGGAAGQPGTVFNVVQPENGGVAGTTLGYPQTTGAPPRGGNTLMDQDIEPPMPTMALSLPPSLLGVGPPRGPLTFGSSSTGGGEELPVPQEENENDNDAAQAPQAPQGPQVVPPAPDANPPAPADGGQTALPAVPVSVDLPATWEQTLDALLDQPAREEEAAYRVADQAVGSWSIGLALAGLALESRQRDRARQEGEIDKVAL